MHKGIKRDSRIGPRQIFEDFEDEDFQMFVKKLVKSVFHFQRAFRALLRFDGKRKTGRNRLSLENQNVKPFVKTREN